ncbi:neuroligin-1-like isoform X2 [Stegodyphus dumicola]|uniref:neuroligin-1-like isoform X2 n=1 Tax=Stegodyphus dumicola TaxID=202533 RepID=UPI0015AE1000|nr:neuroligin-1-like isoform X2 [Stegodyphus dumicola]
MVQHFLRPYLQYKSNFEAIAKAVKYHYLKGAVIPSFASIEPVLANMMSDFLYVTPLYETLKSHSRITPNTFMYVFKDEDEGMNHIEDESYLFNKTFKNSGRYQNSSKDQNVIQNLCKIWGNFIKLKFLPLELKWKQFGNHNQMNYAEISKTVVPKTGYRRNEIEFWILLLPDLDDIQNLHAEIPQEDTSAEKITSRAWSAVGLVMLFGVLCVSLVGVVVITRSRIAQSSILPISSRKDDIKYSSI